MANPLHHSLKAAFEILPVEMYSARALQLLYAIGWQESRFENRRQIGGPARGFWQFEMGGGVRGVMSYSSTANLVPQVLDTLQYPKDLNAKGIYTAIEHNDILAACLARLLLWTLPDTLPNIDDPNKGWEQYKAAWRPGKPHPKTWLTAWAHATSFRKDW